MSYQESAIRFFSFKMSASMWLSFFFITMSVGCLRAQAVGSQIINTISVSSNFRSGVMHHVVPTQLPTQNSAFNVFFSKPGTSSNVFGVAFPVKRVLLISHNTSTSSRAGYAIQQLIAGPTRIERQAGYQSLLQQSMFGKSSCPGQANFILTLDKKGTLSRPGVATIKFCRSIGSAGIGVDALIRAEVESTLKQFSAIKAVVILSSDGHCFGDDSGSNLCLR